VTRIRIGTRGSALALWQAHHVRDRLAALGHEVELRVIVTTGDRVLDRRLENVGGKGAFLKEIEEAMLAGEVDLAVHSLKDVPTSLPAGLSLCAILERADPRDALLSGGACLADLPKGARVGTTSLRRRALVAALRPDVVLEDLRGNVDTRINRLREGRFDAILLAMAGLTRLGRASEVTEALDPRAFVPAPGQGAIALECRDGDADTRAAVAPLHHPPTAGAVAAERAFLGALGGGCNVPLGAHAFAAGAELELVGFVAAADGSTFLRGEARGEDPAETGRRLASQLVEKGATALLDGAAGA
jgi:hydroxymethylbilane synthase